MQLLQLRERFLAAVMVKGDELWTEIIRSRSFFEIEQVLSV
jgi:hypothetical protein